MRKIVNLNRKWTFSKEFDKIPDKINNRWCFVNLPHTWNNIDGQDGGNDYYRGKCLYMKEIAAEEIPEADKYFIEFNGTNSSAVLYVNGKYISEHDGGYSTWRADITNEIKDSVIIAVIVDNSPNEKVYPQMADFTFYGGIYRDVNLICVNSSHFDLEYYGGPGLSVTPKIIGSNAKINIKVYLCNTKENQKLRFKIEDAENKLIAEKIQSASEDSCDLVIEDVTLWNGLKNPYLYKATVELYEKDELKDRVFTSFGCRTFKIDPQMGFILNEEEYPLRGVSRHQDRWSFGNALLKEHHEEDIKLICEIGANTVRLAHYQHDKYFYELCDKYGLIVWAEIPYISNHLPEGRENTVNQMKELITQNYNHPSIVVWGLSNEINMHGTDESLIENHRILNELCHSMDKTRQTVIACVSMCDINDPYIKISDAVAYNHYFGWYGGSTDMNGPWFDEFHEKHPDIPIGCSEYGCEALNWHTSTPAQGDYTEEYQSYYHEELIKQLFTRKYLWATYVWNMFDFGADARNEGGENGQNHKGLVSFDRKYKKDAFYAYKAWLSQEPFVHLCGKRYIERVEETTKVTVYSNQPEVELFANGKSLGKKSSETHFFVFDVPNEGETRLTAKAGNCIDISFIKKTDKFNEIYRMKEKGAILNWFDIEEKKGYLSLNNKVSDIVATDEGKKLISELIEAKNENEKIVMDFTINENLMKMMGGFTLLRLISLLGMTGHEFTKDELLDINKKLNSIKKL